ncbi:flavin reductase family protein [Nocardia inohanensis]|uniref:flavin reductase family protein n=1 Tax=Nocardia inohanensis TaxID=209246 RepID=UPI000AA3DC12|nr:flavin reductase family protein [Nocardia inohanensis]
MKNAAPRVQRGFDLVVAAADNALWIVTTVADGERAGCLVGFGTQVSIEPRRFLACLSKQNHTFPVAERATHLAVHLVPANALALAQLFGGETGTEINKFDHCDWQEGPHALPILTAAAGWFAGEIIRRDDFGDHVGFLIAPTDSKSPPEGTVPLRLRDTEGMTPGHPA